MALYACFDYWRAVILSGSCQYQQRLWHCKPFWALSEADVRKIDALDQCCLRRILDIRWYYRVSNWEVRRLTEQPLLTSIIQKRWLVLFGHLIRMHKSADARKILTAVPQSDWRRPVGRPHSSWAATLKNDLSLHNLTYEDAIEMALDKPLRRLLAASGATHWWCMPNNDDGDDLTIKAKQEKCEWMNEWRKQ